MKTNGMWPPYSYKTTVCLTELPLFQFFSVFTSGKHVTGGAMLTK